LLKCIIEAMQVTDGLKHFLRGPRTPY